MMESPFYSTAEPNDSCLFINLHDSKKLTIDNLINYIKQNSPVEEPIVEIDHDEPNNSDPLKLNMTCKLNSNLELNRVGVMQKYKNHNVSLYTAVLTCVKSDFAFLGNEQQLYVDQLCCNLIAFVNGHDYYKQDLVQQLKTYEGSNMIVRVIADYFHINVFVIKDDKFYVANGFNCHKKNIFLYSNGFFEAVFYKNMKISPSDADLVSLHKEKLFEGPEDNIATYLKPKNIVLECSEVYDNNIPDISDDDDKLTPEQIIGLSKKKLAELQSMATSKGIALTVMVNGKSKGKTKAQLIAEITKG